MKYENYSGKRRTKEPAEVALWLLCSSSRTMQAVAEVVLLTAIASTTFFQKEWTLNRI